MDPAASDAVPRPVPVVDDELWQRSLGGDGEAFGVLFDRHRDRVFRHAWRLADSRQEAEDIAAAAFLELWRRRADVRLVRDSVLPWLLVTTTNVGRNAARGTRRYRAFLDQLPRSEASPDVADVLLDTHGLGIDARLRDGLRALSRTDAQLISLVALEGYPVAEAAEHLGLTPAAAKSRLHRARLRLRACLGEPEQHNAPAEQDGQR